MTKRKTVPGYVPNPDYSQEDWDEVCDNPELTPDELANMRPAAEVLPPDLHEALVKRARGPQRAPTKQLVSLRLSRDVLDHFRATGPGWQRRIDEALRRAMAE
jgi:uncharacterized protein (DUF4415 family)